MKTFLKAGLLVLSLSSTARASYSDLYITEIMPDSASSPDWFELTNTGATSLSLSNFTMDDSSASYANSVYLNLDDGLIIGGHETIVFLETDTPATAIAKFRTFWGGAAVNIRIGYYSGAGVGFSKDSPDGVTLFNQIGAVVTQVGYLSPAPDVSESFSAFNPQTDSRSAVGVNGGYRSAGDSVTNPFNIGSPGLIPEPATAVLLALSVLPLLRWRARRV